MRKVHVYIRVSDPKKQTHEQQWLAIQPMLPPDVEIVKLVDMESGWDRKALPAYHKLKSLIQKKQCKELFTFSCCRLGRSRREALAFVGLCMDEGVKLKTIKEGFDFASTFGPMLYLMFATVAEMESELKSDRIKAKFDWQKEQGTFIGHGRAPHAITQRLKDKARLVYQEMDNKKSYREIAELLEISVSSVQKLARLRGKPLMTADIVSKLCPDWWKRQPEDYPTQDELFAAYRKMYPKG